MADFMLVQKRTRACRFLQDARSVMPPDYVNWQGIWHEGQHLVSDKDVISIIPLDAAFQEAQLIIRSPGKPAHINMKIACAIPEIDGAVQKVHYMIGLGDHNDTIYVYRLDNSLGGAAILLQRFVIGGGHSGEEPSVPGVIDYLVGGAPVVADAPGALGLGQGGIIPTQDDEGSGEHP